MTRDSTAVPPPPAEDPQDGLLRLAPGTLALVVYLALVAVQALWIVLVTRLRLDGDPWIPAFLCYLLVTLVLVLPLRFGHNLLGLSFLLLVPNVAAGAGWLPGISLLRYNALVLPAGALCLYVLWAYDRLSQRLTGARRSLEQLAGEDALTGLPNRRQFMRAGEQMLKEVRRYGRPAGMLLIDLDHFKSVNDRYGHAAGDEVLRALARLLREHQRAADLPARLGGEEFGMLLPETDLAGAVAQAERLREACEALRVPVPGGVFAPLTITMSVGAAACGPDDDSLDDVLRRADAAMYHAKRGGRNRVMS